MRLLIFSLALAACASAMAAAPATLGRLRADTCLVPDTVAAAPAEAEAAEPAMSRYDRRVHRYRARWENLIPTQTVVQFAGNMGLLSAGIGWEYGRHKQWETHLLLGFLPKYQSSRNKMTLTIKESFIPWSIALNDLWSVEPLSCGLYVNTVFGSEFWSSQPARYPEDYYQFLSTKARINVFVGQRVELTVPNNRRKSVKSITAFYEISTCDLYIRQAVQDCGMGFWEILSLSLGLKFQLF